MLFWTTGNAPFLFFQIIIMVLWFINIAKIFTCGLWINVNSGLFVFLHWNRCIAGKHRRPFYWPRTTGNQTFLFHIWLLVGPKFLLSWVERICRLIITTSPTDLKWRVLQLNSWNYGHNKMSITRKINKIFKKFLQITVQKWVDMQRPILLDWPSNE